MSDPSTVPTVFLSHATEDNERFARALDTALNAQGMKTIFDERDFRLGDSIVQSVFDNGISASDVVLVLISKNTVNRPWVREELDASVAQMLKGRLRVIPVLLDGVEPPPPLEHRIYLRVTEKMTPEDVAQRVANAVYAKPLRDIGEPPLYANVPRMADHTNIDVFLFGFIVRTRLQQNPAYPWVDTAKILEFANANGISEEETKASLYSLRAFLTETSECGTALPLAYAPTSFGVERYVTSADPSYWDSVRKVVSAIVNDGEGTADGVEQRTGVEPSLVEVILDNLADRGHLKVEKYAEGVYVTAMPTLRRLLE